MWSPKDAVLCLLYRSSGSAQKASQMLSFRNEREASVRMDREVQRQGQGEGNWTLLLRDYRRENSAEQNDTRKPPEWGG